MITLQRFCLAVALVAADPASFAGTILLGVSDVKTYRYDHENILGTSMHLELRAEEEVARKAKADLLAEVERLRGILSSYDPKSEFSRLARPCAATPVSLDLLNVLHACEHWSAASQAAFDPGVELLTRLWSAAQKRGSLPEVEEIDAARARLGRPLWSLDDEHGTLALLSDTPLTLDALAKGYILDRAVAAAKAAGATDIVLEIGGDLCVCGESSSRIAVADPREPEENAESLCELELHAVCAATSGGYARGFEVGGRHYSHVFDPRTGRPVEQVLQATVIAPDATTADALATILNVLSPAEGLALIAATPGTASMVVDAAGEQHASPNWAKFVRSAAPPKPAVLPSALAGGAQIVLDFELQQPAEKGGERGRKRGGSYRRPYVAAWLEDEQSRPVRTLCLWFQKPRWIGDLRRWSELYPGKQSDVRAVTRATRAAGSYELVWDGRDDAGVALAAGKYTLYLEVVREHGTYQLLSQTIETDGHEFSTPLVGDGIEVKSATVSLRAAPSKQ